MKINYAIIFVSDMTRSVAFYRDVLGFSLKFESTHWAEFATGGATLALHLSDEPISQGPGEEPPGHCRPGFQVPNLDIFHQRMVENNVPCNQKPKAVFGARMAQYVDPDGLIFSVGESRHDDEG